MSSQDPALSALVWGHRWANAWYLIPFVILSYDHLLTLGPEIEYVWRKRKHLSFFLFIPLRYISLVSNISMVFLTFGSVSIERCHAWNLGKIALIIVQCILVGNVLFLRVYAIYNFSKPILALLAVVGCVSLSLAIWSISGQTWVLALEVPGCQYAVPPHIAHRMAIAWEAQLFSDLLVFGLTIWRSVHHKIQVQYSILAIIARDGALYFGVLAMVNAANILMYYVSQSLPFSPPHQRLLILTHPRAARRCDQAPIHPFPQLLTRRLAMDIRQPILVHIHHRGNNDLAANAESTSERGCRDYD
ncbi:hypothetical protein C8F01DRAFT_754074 [Mycena amicta]|nr:hypothetical protein C8F01DRAFT_754074 [Mycena amicta]